MARTTVEAGTVSGWQDGQGTPVLILHGGPGLSAQLVESLVTELGDGYHIAAYQQRGLPPSVEHGPFDLATHLSDLHRFLDALGWGSAVLLGHSWGGHLALHAAAALPDLVRGVLAVDALGAVGDGGQAEFERAMLDRAPEEVRERAHALDERAMRGAGTDQDAVESLRLLWPAYFPRWETAPPMPDLRLSVTCYAETMASVRAQLPALEAALSSIALPVELLAGGASPLPAAVSVETAARIPSGSVEIVPDAGHLPWLDVPGCVEAALARLVAES